MFDFLVSGQRGEVVQDDVALVAFVAVLVLEIEVGS